MKLRYNAKQVKKAIVAGVGFVIAVLAQVVDTDIIPAKYKPYVVAIVGAATTYGVFQARNGSGTPAGQQQVP